MPRSYDETYKSSQSFNDDYEPEQFVGLGKVESDSKLTGTVKWFSLDKGYGFLIPDDRTGDIFVHINGLKKSGLQELVIGDRVRFSIEVGKGGRNQAMGIEIL